MQICSHEGWDVGEFPRCARSCDRARSREVHQQQSSVKRTVTVSVCYITFNEAVVFLGLASDGAVLCWGWRRSIGLSYLPLCSALWQMCTNTLFSYMPLYSSLNSRHCFITLLSSPLALLQLSPHLWVLTDFLFAWGQSHPRSGDWLIAVCLADHGLCSLGCCHQQTSLPKSVRGSLLRLQTDKRHHNKTIKAVNVWGLCVGFLILFRH